MIFEIENWLWKLNFGPFWQLAKFANFIWLQLIGQKPCFLGPRQLARRQINIHYHGSLAKRWEALKVKEIAILFTYWKMKIKNCFSLCKCFLLELLAKSKAAFGKQPAKIVGRSWVYRRQRLCALPRLDCCRGVSYTLMSLGLRSFQIMYRTRTNVTRSWFEAALVYKPRILSYKNVSCNTNQSAA